ncbi:multidrug effflux MFS transporter [Devosia sp. ZB163]|uniref:multidrug effflux MFS transporter n=1 Tax=Devosia sp. ZB163 TaxID=3025938 RepID=UPI002360EF0B|nr:multidrug effflux MFS transporter [Devosia sp. ZB163]MDC9824469.1 multidrug effflux MFS transporter [Devosia sp. ZB163]
MSDTAHSTRELSRVEFIALVAALMALNALAIDVMLPALPYMGEALGISHENERQFVVGVYMLGFGFAQLAFGPLSDRFGRRGPLLIGLAIYVICAFAAVFAPTFAILLAIRFTQGLGAAATRVIATSIVRDKYSGRAMAEVMSLTFMVFMVVPILAPGIGQVILLSGPWQYIFLFMGGLATLISIWAFFRLPETLRPEYRRPLTLSAIAEGFRLVLTNRSALFYGLAGMFLFAGLFSFISTSQQIFVEIYGLGALFPVAFALMAGTMSIGAFTNSRIVSRFGMRRLSHFSIIVYVGAAALLVAFSLAGFMPLWLFFGLLLVVQWMFGWAASNMNSLSMEPLGAVAGTAASVFGFTQTVGGVVIGTAFGQMFDGTVTPTAAGYLIMGLLTLGCVLIAEKGRLFGVSPQYAHHGDGGH